MDWREDGILLSHRRHGESSAIIETLTPGHGRHAGLVRGGAGRRLAPVLQPGAQLSLVWRGRLAEHLGSFTVEPLRARAAAAMAEREALSCLSALCALACAFLPEREPVPVLYDATLAALDALDDPPLRRAAYARWEVLLLRELGFGLDLGQCALTGATDDLAYVSPKSGRAASRAAVGNMAERLLPLPAFLLTGGPAGAGAFHDSLTLTGHFLSMWAAGPIGLPDLPPARRRLADYAARAASASSSMSSLS